MVLLSKQVAVSTVASQHVKALGLNLGQPVHFFVKLALPLSVCEDFLPQSVDIQVR